MRVFIIDVLAVNWDYYWLLLIEAAAGSTILINNYSSCLPRFTIKWLTEASLIIYHAKITIKHDAILALTLLIVLFNMIRAAFVDSYSSRMSIILFISIFINFTELNEMTLYNIDNILLMNNIYKHWCIRSSEGNIL